jgi:hypothetical protein
MFQKWHEDNHFPKSWYISKAERTLGTCSQSSVSMSVCTGGTRAGAHSVWCFAPFLSKRFQATPGRVGSRQRDTGLAPMCSVPMWAVGQKPPPPRGPRELPGHHGIAVEVDIDLQGARGELKGRVSLGPHT